MNVLQQIVFTAGQKTHEKLLGATLVFESLPLKPTVPCTSSRIRKGWILSNGQSPQNFVESIKFFRSRIPAASFADIQKGLLITLKLSTDSPPTRLRLDEGGLMTDGLTFDFQAHDLNQGA